MEDTYKAQENWMNSKENELKLKSGGRNWKRMMVYNIEPEQAW